MEATLALGKIDLAALYLKRKGQHEFKMRDQAYKVFEDAYLGQDRDKKEQYVTWRPQMIDGIQTGDSRENKAMINLCRQIVNHHTASFARPPRVRNVPYSPDGIEMSERKTHLISGVFHRSRIKALQGIQSWRLSNRGDAVYGIEWGKDNERPFIKVRAVDPSECYPDMDTEDIGGMRDLLICREVRRDWAEKTFNIQINKQDASVKWYVYWTTECRYMQVENIPIEDSGYTFEHGLGFVPWRWVFNCNNGLMGQSDITEVPKLQALISDSTLLVMDAARKLVDKAYWGRGITGDANPRPGETVVFPNPQAQINEFPTSAPPEALTSVIQLLQGFAQAQGGISPISMEGMASGSIVTGSAVRHQVEAIEARSETKRVALEHGFGILGEYILRVLEKQFPEERLIEQVEKQGEVSLAGSEINAWYTCEATYGDFMSLSPAERLQFVLQGIGRVHGARTGISIVYPDADVDTMLKEVEDFQISQAAITGRSQAVAQAAAGGGEQGGPSGGPMGAGSSPGGSAPPAGPPVQPNPFNQPPGQAATQQAMGGQGQMVELGQLTSLLDVVRAKLKGDVWAVGEIAAAGRSSRPRVMVEEQDDQGVVASAFKGKVEDISVGTPGKDEPKVTL